MLCPYGGGSEPRGGQGLGRVAQEYPPEAHKCPPNSVAQRSRGVEVVEGGGAGAALGEERAVDFGGEGVERHGSVPVSHVGCEYLRLCRRISFPLTTLARVPELPDTQRIIRGA
jgi:hypothetical protein